MRALVNLAASSGLVVSRCSSGQELPAEHDLPDAGSCEKHIFFFARGGLPGGGPPGRWGGAVGVAGGGPGVVRRGVWCLVLPFPLGGRLAVEGGSVVARGAWTLLPPVARESSTMRVQTAESFREKAWSRSTLSEALILE